MWLLLIDDLNYWLLTKMLKRHVNLHSLTLKDQQIISSNCFANRLEMDILSGVGAFQELGNATITFYLLPTRKMGLSINNFQGFSKHACIYI